MGSLFLENIKKALIQAKIYDTEDGVPESYFAGLSRAINIVDDFIVAKNNLETEKKRYIYKDIKKEAIAIINQLFDLAEVSVEKRQEINDKADEYMVKQLMLYNSNSRRDLLKGFMKHIEKDGAIKFIDYEYSIKNFEEENYCNY